MSFIRGSRGCLPAILLSILCLVFSVTDTNAQLDPTFGNGGVTTTDVFGDDTAIGSFSVAGGKTFVVDFARTGTQFKFFFLRYNADGLPDSTYGTGGLQELAVPFLSATDRNISEAVRQSDGKIILAGFDNGDGLVMRFNEDGSLDTTFSGDGIHRPNISQGYRDGVNSIAIQADGKILIGGFQASSFWANKLFLLRYLPNGELDPSFGDQGSRVYDDIYGNTDMGSDVLIQSTGRIVVANPTEYQPNQHARLRRFTSNGTIDGTVAEVFASLYRTVGMQPDDKLLVGTVMGGTPIPGLTHLDVRVTRFNANGGIDTSFGTGGMTGFDMASAQDDSPTGFVILPDGQIVVSVSTYITPNRTRFRYYTLGFAKLTATGVLNGKFFATNAFPVLQKAFNFLTSDGRIMTTQGHLNPISNNGDLLVTRSISVPMANHRLRAVPFDFGFPLDGRAEATVFRPANRTWWINGTSAEIFFGLSDDILVPSDYIGNFANELAVFRPSNGTWYIANSFSNPATNFTTVRWGTAGDIPVPNDYDGDGKSDVAVFRPSDGVWYIRNSADSSATFVPWGLSGDKPVPGDYDGDGKIDVAVWRPSNGVWYILRSSDGQARFVHFGLGSDIPVAEDYDGDTRTDIAVWRPSDGIWYRLNSSDGSFYGASWGISTDIPTPGDFDGDLKTDIAVWRASEGRWYILQSWTGTPSVLNWGLSTDKPVLARN